MIAAHAQRAGIKPVSLPRRMSNAWIRALWPGEDRYYSPCLLLFWIFYQLPRRKSSVIVKRNSAARRQRKCGDGAGFLAYGPLDNAIYGCRIAPYATDEQDLAKLHMTQFLEPGLNGSLLLFDCWYPSAAFNAYTPQAGFSFVMRVCEK